MRKRNGFKSIIISVYSLSVAASFVCGFTPGKEIGRHFFSFALAMIKVLPCAFILIGLFEVWIKNETVEKHLGCESGIRGYMWAILFAGTMIGGLYVALPVAHTLYTKGATLGVIFTFLGAAAITRIPMTVFEASFMGVQFTLIRLVVSLPLVIISSVALGAYMTKRKYRVRPQK